MTNAAEPVVVGDVGDQGKCAGVASGVAPHHAVFAAWRRKRDQTDSVKSGPDTSHEEGASKSLEPTKTSNHGKQGLRTSSTRQRRGMQKVRQGRDQIWKEDLLLLPRDQEGTRRVRRL